MLLEAGYRIWIDRREALSRTCDPSGAQLPVFLDGNHRNAGIGARRRRVIVKDPLLAILQLPRYQHTLNVTELDYSLLHRPDDSDYAIQGIQFLGIYAPLPANSLDQIAARSGSRFFQVMEDGSGRKGSRGRMQ